MNQTPLGGLRARPGTRGRPRRDRCDVCKDLRGTTAPPGCPRLGGQPPASRRVSFLAPWDLYIEAPRLGRGVADLGRTYAASGAPRLEAPGPTSTPSTRKYQSTKLKTTGGEGGHVIHQSFPEDRGRFSNSSCRAAAAGESGDRRWRCRRSHGARTGTDVASVPLGVWRCSGPHN